MLKLINKYSRAVSQVEVEFLLSAIFKCTRAELYIKNAAVDNETQDLCDSLIKRRLSGEPVQYITNSAEFMGLSFVVNRDVFIPRPETELLVNEVLLRPSALPVPREVGGQLPPLTILDLCTGCGNIAISLSRLLPGAEVVGMDISESALSVARKNALIHNVHNDVLFFKGDLFHALPFDKKYRFDIIVCNPPYIKSGEVAFLQEEVKHEPAIALDGGVDGLDFYRRIAEFAHDYLTPEGSLFLEIGFGQAEDLKDIFTPEAYRINKVSKDFSGIDRVLWIDLL